MAAIKIFEGDVTKMILAKYKPQMIVIKPYALKIFVEDKDTTKVMEKDPLLKQQLNQAAAESVQKAVEALAKEVKTFDKANLDAYRATGDRTTFEANIDKFEQAYEKKSKGEIKDDAEKAAKKAWEEYAKTRKDYRNYKIRIGVTFGACVVGAALGVTAAATAAAGNLTGLIAGSISAARAASKGYQTIRAYAKSAWDVWADLSKDLAALEDNYKDMSKAFVTGKEVLTRAIAQLTTVSLNSIKGCRGQLNEFRTKLNGLEGERHKAARGLNKLLDDAEEMATTIKKSKVEKFIAKTKDKLATVEENVNKAIEGIIDLGEKINEGKGDADDVAGKLDELEKKLDNKVYYAAAIVLFVADMSASVWGSAGGPESIQEFVGAQGDKVDKLVNAFETIGETAKEFVADM